MPDQPSDPRLGTEIAGYRIERRIGRGGMGVVYLAEHLTLRRRAAFKLIAPDLADTSGFRERFLREARIAASLDHPNVVTVYDAGEVADLLYIAMQYVPGSDLAQILGREGRLGPYRVLDIARQVASALDAAHAAALIHRDVKPANVLIDGRHAYLTDFGLTKLRTAATQLTRSGEVVGTTHYLAPEQVEGREIDGRADVYALGCLVYHCLTGRVPFPRDTDMAVMYAHVHDEPPKLSDMRPGLPPGLDGVIQKALDKSPERRFPTCEELVLAALSVVDAHGPLSESSASRTPSSTGRAVPAQGDAPDMITETGREVPSTGDPSSMHTLTGVVGPGGRPLIVLLAGVDSNVRAVARVALGQRGQIHEADTLDAALETARDHRPDLVLVDAQSMDVPASAVCKAIRTDPITRDAKIVLLSSQRQGARRAVATMGADDSLATPFSPLQLQVKLRRLLGGLAVGA